MFTIALKFPDKESLFLTADALHEANRYQETGKHLSKKTGPKFPTFSDNIIQLNGFTYTFHIWHTSAMVTVQVKRRAYTTENIEGAELNA